nr:MAG TPA: hypothetical protein [Caudoviricetes sp.]
MIYYISSSSYCLQNVLIFFFLSSFFFIFSDHLLCFALLREKSGLFPLFSSGFLLNE